MNTNTQQPNPSTSTIRGKPVIWREAKTVLNLKAQAFQEKQLCGGGTLNTGDACVFNCVYCYVAPSVHKYLHPTLQGNAHEDVVVRRADALKLLQQQLLNPEGLSRFTDPNDNRVIYSSTLVDVAATMTLARETAEACNIIFQTTPWQVRLLTKSNLLPKLIELIPEKWHQRLILGVSTGTFDDSVARAIEIGTPLVSKRIESLHWLQDRGFRTFGMICPSLPQVDYDDFGKQAAEIIRAERCEHVWAEVINVRGPSFTRTHEALNAAGLRDEAQRLATVSVQEGDTAKQKAGKSEAWETYARETFLAHARHISCQKLKFLQYVTKLSQPWWKGQAERGAVLLGKAAHQSA